MCRGKREEDVREAANFAPKLRASETLFFRSPSEQRQPCPKQQEKAKGPRRRLKTFNREVVRGKAAMKRQKHGKSREEADMVRVSVFVRVRQALWPQNYVHS